MRSRENGRRQRGFRYSGMLIFFVLIALVIQFAVIIYDYIIQKTDNELIIALMMLNVIIVISLICTVCDIIRRKVMVDRPVEEILRATERIAAGDFTVRIPTRHAYEHYDEFDLVIENINMMTSELSRSEILKSEFISNVSHELKTPLAIIGNYSVALSDPNLDTETRLKHAEALSNASRRLSDLVTNILRLNKLENQKIKPDVTEYRLSDQLAECVIGFEELIERKELELECELDEDIFVHSSPSYLEIVWNNLLSNAIKFTEPKGRVGVRLYRKGEEAVVEVSDTGCGISPEVGSHIFEKFYQGDNSHAQEGNGLGLALVKRVIDAIGGTISVSSEPGVGTVFTVAIKTGKKSGKGGTQKSASARNSAASTNAKGGIADE